MAQFIKHVGINGQGKKVVVVFREVPGDAESALVIPTESLPPMFHDDLIRAVESNNCQGSNDPSEFLFRQVFNDGTNMLNTIHQRGWMVKVPTKSVVMTPKPGTSINLVDLNRELTQLNRERAAAGADVSGDSPNVITDSNLAAKYRQQANSFEAEARKLREEAEVLDPKGHVAVVPKSPAQPSTEAKRGRGRPAKVA